MSAREVIRDVENKMKKSVEATKREFAEVRTGRAHPGLIEGLHADYYGTPTMFKELASITIPDPKTIIIQPWDTSVIPEIEKAIQNSHLGITPMNDGKIVRLPIPPLSEERRNEMKRVVKEMAEKGKISLRTIRRDANDRMKKLKSDKTISEDDDRRAQDEIQKLTDQYIKEIDRLVEDKSAALSVH